MQKQQNPFSGLRFERPRRLAIPKSAVIGFGLLIFTLLWWLLPSAVLYWLILITLCVLGWVASFGWRSALAALHDLLRRLEEL